MRRWVLGTLSGAAAIAVSAGAGADLRSYHEVPVPKDKRIAFQQVGTASWYGPGFHGNLTANGEIFDQNRLSAAHRRLPLGAEVTVTNLENGKTVTLEVNDRGPYIDGRVIDLSKAAARRLGMVADGVAKVRIQASPQQLAQAEDRPTRTRTASSVN